MASRRLPRPGRLQVCPNPPCNSNGISRCLSRISLSNSTTRSLVTGPEYLSKYPSPDLYTSLPAISRLPPTPKGLKRVSTVPPHIAAPFVHVTLYSFPDIKPIKLINYPSTHLHLPLRKDILHRAVVYEGDRTRQGSANTKWRSEVHGSGKKIRPQKGSGRARLGDKKSPMLRGGGVAFGPKPRDFSTGLPRKIYDLAWRTALSYRYRRGELVVVDKLEVPQSVEDGLESFDEDPRLKAVSPPILKTAAYLEMFRQGEEKMRSMFVVQELSYELDQAFKVLWKEGKIRDVKDVDVKNLLEMDRVVIEQEALDSILRMHQRDLKSRLDVKAAHGQARRDAVVLNAALEKTRLLQESKLTTPA